MASEMTVAVPTQQQLAAQAQFSTSDYGRVGDQRPYQIVQPAYPAPKWLARFQNLNTALRECGTLCQLTGQPFRLVKWGASVPCYPCRVRKTTNSLPSLRIHSPGALDGHPDALPIADFQPNAAPVVYDGNGQPKVVGGANFIVSRSPVPPSFYLPKPPLQRYLQAVKTAQYLSDTTGRRMFICSSLGADCQGGGKKGYVPVVYVDPGGLVRRYPQGVQLTGSSHGSTVAANSVTEDEFKELVRQSAGQSRLGWGT